MLARTTRMTLAHARVFSAGLAVAASGVALGDATDVPRGGATFDGLAGSQRIVINIKNTTGTSAKDVTVTLLNDVGDIEVVDILETDADVVDDNGNGRVDDREDDTTDDSAGRVTKSILTEGEIADDEERQIIIELSQPASDNAQLLVKLSTQIGDVHFDMLSIAPLDADETALVGVDPGAAQVATMLLAAGSRPITGASVRPLDRMPEAWPPVEIVADVPLEWRVDGGLVELRFIEPLVPGDAFELGMILPWPVETMDERFDLAVRARGDGGPCRADLDGDGELTLFDFLAFQNLFDAGDTAADFDGDGELTLFDFLAFQNAFDAGCP